ncbi:MAG: DUF6768 family protein [Planctomycetota bacterium]|jgi:hypothetical protein
MSESENDVKKALAENGSCDPRKAAELKKKASGAFSARLRNVERVYWVFFVLCVCFGFFAYLRFRSPSTTATKTLIGYAIVMLIAYESTVLIKLWYWIANSKLSVLKDLKQLRLESPLVADREALPNRESEGPLRSISWRERIVWIVGIIVFFELAVNRAVPAIYSAIVGYEAPPDLTHEGYLTLAADGSGTSVTQTSFINTGIVPITSFPFDDRSGSTIRWIDDRGREVPTTVSEEDGRRGYEIRFIDPVMPGQASTCKRVMETPASAAHEADLWTYRQDLRTSPQDLPFGPETAEYTETVMLPQGAEIVSTSLEPVRRYVRDNRPVLRFQARCDEGEHFRYTIEYRLPPEPADRLAE